MTLIVGNVVDVGLDPVSGTLQVWSGFRPEATSLITPRRRTYDIVAGAIPADVHAAPGPAVILIDIGIDGHTQIDVVIPDAAEVTIQDLFLQGYVWEPYVLSAVYEDRIRAEQAADRAEAAAEDVDAAIANAAQVVVEGVEQDRIRAEQAREGAETARDEAVIAKGSAETAAGTAGTHASSASADLAAIQLIRDTEIVPARNTTTTARDQTILARDAAATSATQAGTARDSASTHADRAEAAANDFGLTFSSTTLPPESAATVSVVGDGPAYAVTLGIPEGKEGQPGTPGEVSQAQLTAAVDGVVDGAPAPYDSLGKLVDALLAGDLGGSTDASVLIGALTNQVDASASMVTHPNAPAPVSLADLLNSLLTNTSAITALGSGKADIDHKHAVPGDLVTTGTASATTYLRGDGSWQTPPDTNTTYALPTQAEAEAGTATTARTFSAQRVRQAAVAAIKSREWDGTQAAYDAIVTKDPNVTYYVHEG